MAKQAKTAEDKKPKIRQVLDCPKCGKEMVLGMRMPGRRMMWYCFPCDYEQLKMPGDWKK